MSKYQIQPECGERAGWRGTGRPNLSRETKFSGANEDKEIPGMYFPCLADHERGWPPSTVDQHSVISDGHVKPSVLLYDLGGQNTLLSQQSITSTFGL